MKTNTNARPNRMTREQVIAAKNSSPCKRCGQFGHWYGDHCDDGSLPAHVSSSPSPIVNQSNSKFIDLKQTEKSDVNNKVLKFNNSTALTELSIASSDPNALDAISNGPLVDSGAPYSAIGIVELAVVAAVILPRWNGQLDAVPNAINNCRYWQYGNGNHASEPRKINGSISLPCRTDTNTVVWIRHLVLDGSSQWVIGQNVTSFGNICQIGNPLLVLQQEHNDTISFPLTKVNRLLYMPTSYFGTESNARGKSLSSSSAAIVRPWNEIKTIVDRVHRHVCGHSNYGDIKTLLERNNLLNDDVCEYIQQLISNCRGCRSTLLPKPARKVSLSSLNGSFNQVICIDHMFPGDYCVAHLMDSKTRYSSGVICDDTSMNNAIYALQIAWLTPFWTPESIRGDDAFNNSIFKSYVNSIGSCYEAIPPRPHQKKRSRIKTWDLTLYFFTVVQC